MPGSNVSDTTRLEFLERGRMAFKEALRKKEEYQSAWRVYSQLVKDAKKVGASEIAWTLEAMRRDPLDVEREISERVRMAKLVNLPLGFQLNMFETDPVEPASTPPGRGPNGAGQGDAKPAEVSPPKPPVREPDDEPEGPDEEESEEPAEPEEPEEEEAQPAKAGNEMLEQSEDEANAYLQGQRSFLLGRALAGNPYSSLTPMHNAWIRGWKAKELAGAQ